MNITCGFGCNRALELKQKHTSVTSCHRMPPSSKYERQPYFCKILLPKISIEPFPWIFAARSRLQNEIWDFSETFLGAKSGKHFSFGKNVCITGKINWCLLARQQWRMVTAGGWLLDEKPCGPWHSQRTSAAFFSAPFCLLGEAVTIS